MERRMRGNSHVRCGVGKFCDYFKGLPITISARNLVRLPCVHPDRTVIHLEYTRIMMVK